MSRSRLLMLLGLDGDATLVSVKQRYRELARRHHPDVNPDDDRAHARFRAIAAAYTVLLREDRGQLVDCATEPVMTIGRAAMRSPTVVETRSETELRATRDTEKPPVRVVVVEVTLSQVVDGAQLGVALADGRIVLVDLPPGAETGTLLKPRDVPDLIVEVSVLRDPVYRRQGADLLTRLSLPAADALRGARRELATPSGRVVLLIPSRSRHGDVIRVIARGVPSAHGRGDLYVELAE